MKKTKKQVFKSGFISIVGKPNVGKSTLLNLLLGRKIAPVSRKPQTTRLNIHGIRNDENSQLIFVDTPGIHSPSDQLGRIMVSSARKAFGEADLVYFMVEPRKPDADDMTVFKDIRALKAPVFLVMNKIDLLDDKQHMLPLLEYYNQAFAFKEIIPISAMRKIQSDLLIEKTKEHLPEGPQYFPPDMISDQPIEDTIKELIREKVVRFTGDEIPYVTTVFIDSMQTRTDGLLSIQATIVVERESQKGILIGKGGLKMKQIGQAARQELERFLNKKIYLGLWVKVVTGWKKDPERLRRLGYNG